MKTVYPLSPLPSYMMRKSSINSSPTLSTPPIYSINSTKSRTAFSSNIDKTKSKKENTNLPATPSKSSSSSSSSSSSLSYSSSISTPKQIRPLSTSNATNIVLPSTPTSSTITPKKTFNVNKSTEPISPPSSISSSLAAIRVKKSSPPLTPSTKTNNKLLTIQTSLNNVNINSDPITTTTTAINTNTSRAITSFTPPSPIASASPKAKKLNIQMYSSNQTPSTNSSISSSNMAPTPKKAAKLLFSPGYTEEKKKIKLTNSIGANKSQINSSVRKPSIINANNVTRINNNTVQTANISYVANKVIANNNNNSSNGSSSNNNINEEDEFDPFLFIKCLPSLATLSPDLRPCNQPLPNKSLSAAKITLALDLDETLVHCSITPLLKYDLIFNVEFNNLNYCVYVKLRPGMYEFLNRIKGLFEICIFTASQQIYADKLLDIIDPENQYIQYRVFRDSCICYEGNYLKDLTVLGRNLQHTVIIDNSIQAFGFQLNNGIPIESYFDDDNDNELMKLIPLLEKLKDCQDVRPIIASTFKLQELVDKL